MGDFGFLQAFNSWHGAVITGMLVILSVYLTALIITRFHFFKRIDIDSQKLLKDVHKAISSNDMKVLEEFRGRRESDPPVRIIVGTCLSHSDLPSSELNELLSVTKMRQVQRLSRGLPVFSTLATIAPFIGLLGTVIGIVESFNSLASTGAAGPNVVAAGVAEALWATAVGLVVAIPSVVAHNIFRTKIKNITTDMEVVAKEIALMSRSDNGHKKLRAV